MCDTAFISYCAMHIAVIFYMRNTLNLFFYTVLVIYTVLYTAVQLVFHHRLKKPTLTPEYPKRMLASFLFLT